MCDLLFEIKTYCISILITMNISDWISLFVALATFYLGYTTWKMAKVTQKTLDERNKPYIIVYARQDKERASIIEVVIENIGLAPAYDVKFEIPNNFRYRCWGIDKESAKEGEQITYGAFATGIPMLVPNQQITIDWGQYYGIVKSLGNDEAKIITTYKDIAQTNQPLSINILSIKEFAASSANETNSTKQVTEITKIPKQLEKIYTLLNQKLKPQSSIETYKWAYITYILLEKQYPLEYLHKYEKGAGLTSDQICQAESEAREIIMIYRPELIENDFS